MEFSDQIGAHYYDATEGANMRATQFQSLKYALKYFIDDNCMLILTCLSRQSKENSIVPMTRIEKWIRKNPLNKKHNYFVALFLVNEMINRHRDNERFMKKIFHTELFSGLLAATLEHSSKLTEKQHCHAIQWRHLVEQLKELWLLSGIFNDWKRDLDLSPERFPYAEWCLRSPPVSTMWWHRLSPDSYSMLMTEEYVRNCSNSLTNKATFPSTPNLNPFRLTRQFIGVNGDQSELALTAFIPEFYQEIICPCRVVTMWSLDLPNFEVFTPQLIQDCREAYERIFY